MARKAFSIHSDYYAELKNLESTRRGDLLLALINWATDQDPPPLDSEAAMLFRLMCAQIERISAVNSKNGSQGGRPSEKSGESEKSGDDEGNRKKPTVSVTAPVSVSAPVAASISDTKDHPPTPASGGVSPPSAQERRFNEFWASYPKKTAKQTAQKAWKKLKVNDTLHAQIMAGIERSKHSDKWRRESGRYIPNPATWLNGGCWDDELPEAGGGAQSGTDNSYRPSKPRGFRSDEPTESGAFNPDSFGGFRMVGDEDDPGGGRE